MLCEVEWFCPVLVPAKCLDSNGLVPESSVLTYLLKQFSKMKAAEEVGYFIALTKLKRIGDGKFNDSSRYILFPVSFYCRTFLPVAGEIMHGVVYAIRRHGVFLKCGPMNHVYLSARKMPNYYYVDGENPHFLDENLSRIDIDIVIRFVVLATRWTLKNREIEREFMVLANLEGDGLGPVSLAGFDGLDL